MARLLIGAGGTGGHVYPALAVVEALHKFGEDEHKLTFVGTRGGGGFERRLVEESNLRFHSYEEVFAGPVVGIGPVRASLSLVKMCLGVLQALLIIWRTSPQAILLTGGWANVPLALAGWFLKIPMLVYLPDIEPGRTIQLLGKIVERIAATVPDSGQYFREGQVVVTGYPLRHSVTLATREEGLNHFGLDPARKTILVTGGSRGARSINIAIEAIVEDLAQHPVQIIHITGRLDWQRSQENMQEKTMHDEQYHAFEYLDSREMGLALATADVVIGRSGASSLGEFPYFGAASVLIPYPYAWRYQRINAEWIVRNGAGILVKDEDLSDQLLPTLGDLLTNEDKLMTMQACARALHSGDGSQNIAHELLDLAGA